MNTREILSREIPHLNEPIKEMINQGMWFLYEVEKENIPTAKYILKAGDKMILLDRTGKILSTLNPEADDLDYICVVYFNDLQFPKTLSNMAV